MSARYRKRYDEVFKDRPSRIRKHQVKTRYRWVNGRVKEWVELDQPGWFTTEIWAMPLSDLHMSQLLDIHCKIAE